MLGALLCAGVPPWFMVAHSAGETFEGVTDAEGRPAADADRSGGAVFRLDPGWPPLGPGSWPLAIRTLLRPGRHTPASVISGWIPQGFVSTAPLSDQVRRVVPEGWAPHPELADAVAASCAIPGVYRPVEIGGRRYVDGGMYSTSNLDLLRDEKLDLVICLNPTSTLHPIRAIDPREWGSLLFRRASGRRLGSEARTLRQRGIPVILVQPTGEDLKTMSRNLMSTRNRNQVIAVARRTVAAQLQLHEHAELLAGLPPGRPEKVRRPDGPPSEWPPLAELQSS
jgi:NTE family protein